MSIETFTPLPLNIFSTWIMLLDPSDVPPGMSPLLADVEFFPGGVRKRPGLVPQFPVVAGAPQIGNTVSCFGCKWTRSTNEFTPACRWTQPRIRIKFSCSITPKECVDACGAGFARHGAIYQRVG